MKVATISLYLSKHKSLLYLQDIYSIMLTTLLIYERYLQKILL
jgi:hypothetical protein